MTKAPKPTPRMKETQADLDVKNAAMENSGKRLAEHVAALDQALDAMAEQREIMKERAALMKGEGYDPKAVKLMMRRRDEDDDAKKARAELEAVVDTMLAALGVGDEG